MSLKKDLKVAEVFKTLGFSVTFCVAKIRVEEACNLFWIKP